MLWRLGSNRY